MDFPALAAEGLYHRLQGRVASVRADQYCSHSGRGAAWSNLSTLPHYHIGFIGIHEGKTENFVFIDWWSDENELHHHVYVSSPDRPTQFEYMTPSGLAACVWDLRVMSYERDAWVKTVIDNAEGPNFEGYLQCRLNKTV